MLFTLLLIAVGWAAPPAQLAETVRSELIDAQLQLMISPESARAPLGRAARAYAALGLAELEPATHTKIQDALARATQAVRSGDEAAFAAAKAQVWTALLEAGFNRTTEAIGAGDARTAAAWLALREFRQATRFSRPNADATLALRRWQAGGSPEQTLAAVRANLLDSYGARLDETLADVGAARAQGFTVRAAEAAASAQGYFAILAPSFREQRGAAALGEAQTAFSRLVQGGVVALVQSALAGFRAAPLSEGEQGRRAGQLLRFLSLVPVEYARGVRGGEVTVDLEVREAISFQEAATAAFTDLKHSLSERDAAGTDRATELFASLTKILEDASRRVAVAEPDVVRASVETLTETLRDTMPGAWLRQNSTADFDVIEAALSQLEAAVATGAYAQAEGARIEAYAILESGPEAKLTAFAPQYVPPIENLFWYGQDPKGLAYLLSRHAPLAEVQASRAALSAQLAQAQAAVGGSKAPGSVATNAAIIVFREGLEAVLILASLLGSLKGASQKRFRKPLWIGVWSALAASAVTYAVLRGALLAFAQFGEKLEAVVSLVAIAVLLLITNWFSHDSYWTDWMAGFHKKKARILGAGVGQFLGLGLLGFTSVYHEGFETALFLQVLVLEAGTISVLAGVALGLAATFMVGFVVLKVQTKLPYKKMLVVTAVMLGGVLLVMVGNTAHALQVVG
ncbi:MAG: hypothetical protein AVDCRST_MAG86-2237 [uncultured Truepera sp.]|uniref:Ferrous iron transport permease EfeU n=1 Tax=uncultured Truepera sp. TaxID=543023 RepID=A0A6J4VEG3_9DEIN|nr:MAG: hypothetical protein AVDCRST_MAG86-2237 [uncultured Truepera sp.]